jgi:mRNA interferase YafQ
MKIRIVKSNQFKKDWKRHTKSGNYDMSLAYDVIERLSLKEILDQKHNDHELSGKFIGIRDCHIKPDWLLLYHYGEGFEIEVQCGVEVGVKYEFLGLDRLGSHSDLF